jgi:putative glutamine amidotransferase
VSSGELLVSCSLAERATPYLEALAAVGIGGEAVRLVTPATVAAADAADLAAGAAGVLLCGGPDVEPHHYGETPRPDARLSLLPPRDAVELELLAGARAARTPLFAVCRGLQMVNVFLGGTLWQDLPSMAPSAVDHSIDEPRDLLAHAIQVTAGGELAELLAQEPPTLVNSRHHQAVKELAPGLETVAVAPDGIVEALVGGDPGWWLWGVQWHPENLVRLPLQRLLFARFAAAVAARAAEQREPVLR